MIRALGDSEALAEIPEQPEADRPYTDWGHFRVFPASRDCPHPGDIVPYIDVPGTSIEMIPSGRRLRPSESPWSCRRPVAAPNDGQTTYAGLTGGTLPILVNNARARFEPRLPLSAQEMGAMCRRAKSTKTCFPAPYGFAPGQDVGKHLRLIAS